MFCSNCGSEIIEGAKFCIECGTPVPKKEPIILSTREDEIKRIINELKQKVWYYFVDLKAEGPVTREELDQLEKEGTINASTTIWHIETDEAIPFEKIDSLTEEAAIAEIVEEVTEAVEEPEEETAEYENADVQYDEPETAEVVEETEVIVADAYWEEEPEEETVEQEYIEEAVETEAEPKEEFVEEVIEETEKETVEQIIETESAEEAVSEPEEEAKWYYVDAMHERRGPITDSLLNSLIEEGIIHEKTYIWTPGMAAWSFLKDVERSSQQEQTEPEETEMIAADSYWEEEPEASEEETQYTQEVQEEKQVSETKEETKWYYVDRMNNRQGPIDSDNLRSLIKDGIIHERTYLWTSGMAGWALMKDTAFYQPEQEETKDWYYIDSERVRQGKYSDSEMEALLKNGTISQNTYVWKAGMPQWSLLAATPLSKSAPVTSSEPEEEAIWFYRGRDNSRVGPFTRQEIEDLMQKGSVTLHTDVWTKGMANWKPLSSTALAKAEPKSETEWYIQSNGQTMGPYSQSTMLHMLRNREINARTYVWTSGMSDWEQLKDTSLSTMK